jgi:sugar lactone lactonase YvrE
MTLFNLRARRIASAFFAPRVALAVGISLALTFIFIFFAGRTGRAQSGLFVTTFAGVAFSPGALDGQGASARFNAPLGIAVDKDDNVIVADFRNARIRKIAPDGTVTTIAGGIQGFANGVGPSARFYGPAGVAIDKDGNIIVADYGNNRIRQIAPNGLVTTIAGSGQYGTLSGVGLNARFAQPTGVAVDDQGVIYVLDSGTNLVRKIDRGRYVSTLAGNYNGFADGIGTQASFSFSGAAPQVCFDTQGNLIIADFFNSRIRQVTPTGEVSTIAGNGNGILVDGPALQASLFFATGVTRDAQGNILIADWHNAAVRKLDMTARYLSTVAGNGVEDNIDGPASQAAFVRPGGVAVDSKGNIFVSDYFTHTIRRIGAPGPRPIPTLTPVPTPTPTPTPSPTPTPEPTPTPTPGPTPTPSPTPTPTPTPTPAPGEPGTPVNVIVNPSFETGDYSGWRVYTYFIEGGGALLVNDPYLVTDGQYALKFQANGRRLVDSCAQDISLSPGDYTLTADVVPSYGTIATLAVNFNNGAPGVSAATPISQRMTLRVNFTVTDASRPITILAVGNQNRYIRSNFAVDNFRLFRR